MKYLTQRSKCALAIMVLAAVALTVGQADASTVTGFLSTPDFSGTSTANGAYKQNGWGFSVDTGKTMTINRLGFWVSPQDSGNTGVLAVDHTVTLYQYDSYDSGTSTYTYKVISQATVTAGSAGDGNQYAWASIPSITLSPITGIPGARNNPYVVVASEGTDYWGPSGGTGTASYTYDTSFNGTPTGDGALYNANYAPAVGGTSTMSFSNRSYIGPNVGIASVPEPASFALALAGFGLLGFGRWRKQLA